MEGFPGIEDADKGPVDDRFQMLAAVDFPRQDRTQGQWYPAIPPLRRPSAGLDPADYFGRTLVSNLPPHIKVGVINGSIGGCKIELFEPDNYQAYAATAPDWMTNTIRAYSGNPYQHLVDLAKRAQRDGVIKGMLLHQGESNTNDKEWPHKVKGVYENLLRDLNLKAEVVPLLAGEVVHAEQRGVCASMNTSINELPKTVPTARVVSSRGCDVLNDLIRHLIRWIAVNLQHGGVGIGEEVCLRRLRDVADEAQTAMVTIPCGDGHRVGHVKGNVFDLHVLLGPAFNRTCSRQLP